MPARERQPLAAVPKQQKQNASAISGFLNIFPAARQRFFARAAASQENTARV